MNPTNYGCQQVNQEVPALTRALKQIFGVVDKCVQRDPKNVKCLVSKMNGSFLQGNTKEGLAIAEQVLSIAPNSSPIAEFARARIQAAAGNYAQARALFEGACGQGEEKACFRAEVLRGEGF